MTTVGLLVRLKAKEGKEQEVQRFLESGRTLVEAEPATTAWFAIKLGPSEFGIFDAFPDDAGRQAHLAGRVAEALMAQADDLLSEPPDLQPVDVSRGEASRLTRRRSPRSLHPVVPEEGVMRWGWSCTC